MIPGTRPIWNASVTSWNGSIRDSTSASRSAGSAKRWGKPANWEQPAVPRDALDEAASLCSDLQLPEPVSPDSVGKSSERSAMRSCPTALRSEDSASRLTGDGQLVADEPQ